VVPIGKHPNLPVGIAFSRMEKRNGDQPKMKALVEPYLARRFSRVSSCAAAAELDELKS
jgi:hypothetical protein